MAKLTADDRMRTRTSVHEFSRRSFNSAFWEKLVGNPGFGPNGCLIDILAVQLSGFEREQAVFSAVQALRASFPQFTTSQKNWRAKIWDDAVADRIIDVVHHCLDNGRHRPPSLADGNEYSPILQVQPNAFVPWQLFRQRSPVSKAPGIYIISAFDSKPTVEAEPLDWHVIHIGIAEGQGTGDRLKQFEQTALGSTGHCAGFTFRKTLVPILYNNDLLLLRRFHNIYCSWIDLLDTRPREMEARLLAEYIEKWRRWPALNRKG